MNRFIAWFSHLISGLGAINWGLVNFLNFNLVDHIASTSQITYLGHILYAAITMFGVLSIMALFSPKSSTL